MAGLLSGAGLVPLYVAALNRDGPGRECTRTAASAACTDLMDPWPWLAAGALLVIAGALARLLARRG